MIRSVPTSLRGAAVAVSHPRAVVTSVIRVATTITKVAMLVAVRYFLRRSSFSA